jgi:hypothetical protein
VTTELISSEECLNKLVIPATDASYFTFDSDTKMITKYDLVNGPTDVVIPSSINGVTVESIGPGAFIMATSQYCYDEEE